MTIREQRILELQRKQHKQPNYSHEEISDRLERCALKLHMQEHVSANAMGNNLTAADREHFKDILLFIDSVKKKAS